MPKQKQFFVGHKRIKGLSLLGKGDVIKASTKRIAKEKFLRTTAGRLVGRKRITRIVEIK